MRHSCIPDGFASKNESESTLTKGEFYVIRTTWKMLARDHVKNLDLTPEQKKWLYADIGNYFSDSIEITDDHIIYFCAGWTHRLR